METKYTVDHELGRFFGGREFGEEIKVSAFRKTVNYGKYACVIVGGGNEVMVLVVGNGERFE